MFTKTTPSTTNPDSMRLAEMDSAIRHSDSATSDTGRSRPRHTCVESVEYEWTTPLNLPGLIVLPDDSPSRALYSGSGAGVHDDDLIESEDGDMSSAFQFPGRLKNMAPRR